MNSIEELQVQLQSALPAADLKLRKPRNPQGTWWLDATFGDHWVSVEWSARRGFGATASAFGDGYGEGPEEVFAELPHAFERVHALLAERQHTRPPAKVMLRELRARLGATQQQLAERLGVQQAAVSRLERRDDITLASLHRYVEALGGTLEIHVRGAEGQTWPLLPDSPASSAAPRSERGAPSVRRQPSLEALLLRCKDLQASKAFYSQLGCRLVEEQHGKGPLHYSFSSAGLLIELYPSSATHPPSQKVRLALRVNDVPALLKRLRAKELPRVAEAEEHVSERVSTYVLRDPDDNIIELRDLDATPSELSPAPSA